MATQPSLELAQPPALVLSGPWVQLTRDLPAPGQAGDAIAPTIAIVSPTPGVDPGDPGGFPADYATAKDTPIVVDIADANPGVAFVQVSARLPGVRGCLVVYKGSAFLDPFDANSTAQLIGETLRLIVRHDDGWPPGVGAVEFTLDAVDGAGNVRTT